MNGYSQERIAVFLSFSGTGGVERMVFSLCDAFAEKGHPVDLLLIKTLDRSSPILPRRANILHLHASSTASSLPLLIRYLRRNRPAALLSAKDRANRTAVLAKLLCGVPVRLIARMGTHTSAFLAGRPAPVRFIRQLSMRLVYPGADGVIAISEGVARDMAGLSGTAASRIHVIPNPVVSPQLFEQAGAPAFHPWFAEKTAPVVLAAGRLTRQKDFPTLIRAFAALRRQTAARLIILGEGGERRKLEALAAGLGVAGDLDMPGFVENPYAYMSRADLFVLSSAWEGLGNVLVEALALGLPVVSTDCPSGPAEVLAHGKHGRLVPVGDVSAMARAMAETLHFPARAFPPAGATARYALEKSAEAYLEVLMGPGGSLSGGKG
jgi:glycosyltransferase involved in cell wall biosynthesis